MSGMLNCLGMLAGLAALLPAATSARAESDVERIFGHIAASGEAYACFSRHYTKAHLASHPEQNVTDMLVYVTRQVGPDPYYSLNMQVNFRHIRKPFQISGGCSESEDGRQTLGCGVECDGGSLAVRVKDESAILVEIPDQVRIYDPSADADDETNGADSIPRNARFGADDKLFRLDRTDLKDCLPVIYDEETREKIAKGVITQ
ncbi:hypothetical protein [Rhizobium alvei]|uniref:Uncharacterized protein n=1 Tax=Rhizobium alvei TaxID=1132659 RepID=A0ABT8YJY3_9HYPH|nr:hypothetical protein [Rhizobium alvei]MDO6963594.1 hypothetical protein [Rhizobium alvei]